MATFNAMSCSNSFYDHISNCNTAIRVYALLTPATPYQWLFTDKFGKEYTGESISDDSGFIDIPIDALPEAIFTPFSGDFKLEILDRCRKLDFKMAKFYNAIEFSVSPGPREKDNLGCDFVCETSGGGPGNTAVFPFSAVATLNIPWTAFLKSLYGGTPTVQVYLKVAEDTYQLTNVSVTMIGGPYNLSEIDIDFGGEADGYVLIS